MLYLGNRMENELSKNNTITEDWDRVILVGADFEDGTDFELFMHELSELAYACDLKVVEVLTQKLDYPNKATFLGQGKIDELRRDVILQDANMVVFAQTLTPSQLRNIQQILQIPVIDRTFLILEIFSKRAKTKEAKLQVEVARLEYMLPRLVGLHASLSRQGGGSGSMSNKGSGEKKLELDRRYLEHRLTELRRELKHLEEKRKTQRKKRKQNDIYRVALAGYTNAGKSTLMNAMLEHSLEERTELLENKKVFQKDMLFATLDTTVRRIAYPNKIPFLLTDSVGFVSFLPHNLIEAFHSTLEEIKESDLILIVVDASDVNHEEQIEVTKTELRNLDAGNIPCIYVYNKADCIFGLHELPKRIGNKIYLSASEIIGVDELVEMIQNQIQKDYVKTEIIIPYSDGALYSYLKKEAIILSEEYIQDGIKLSLYMNTIIESRLRDSMR